MRGFRKQFVGPTVARSNHGPLSSIAFPRMLLAVLCLSCLAPSATLLAQFNNGQSFDSANQFRNDSREGFRQPEQSPQAPPAVPTNQTSFGIPIEVHQHPDRIAEFQLWISVDEGRNWSHYQSRAPHESEFLFKAEQEGEHWFAMRTIDRNRQSRPTGPHQPELVVNIDTQKPVLRLDAIVGQSGSIITRWQASDPVLLPDSFELKYRAAGGLLRQGGEWLSLDSSTSREVAQGQIEGELNWWPEIEAGAIEISAEIKDAANNSTIVTRRVEIPRVARQLSPETRHIAQLPRDPVQQHRLQTGERSGLEWPADSGDTTQRDPNSSFVQNPHAGTGSNPSGQQQVVASTQPDTNNSLTPQSNLNSPNLNGQDRHSQNSTQQFANQDTANDANPYRPASQQRTVDQGNQLVQPDPFMPNSDQQTTIQRNTLTRDSSGSSDTGEREWTQVGPDQNSPTAPGNHSIGNDNRSTEHVNNQHVSSLDLEALPPGEHAVLTNRRQFRLTYEIDAVRPESVDEVELWITRDGGNHWESWATDPDRISPFPVELPDEGIYGFKIVVRSLEGFSGQSPQPGDLADVWLDIDMTRPDAVIKAAPLGTGPEAGKLIIQWHASDRRLASRPISLYYAESLEGPWQVIAAGIENTGTFPWRVDGRTPKLLFLRLEARDKAGNTTIHDFTTPVDLRRLNPSGRIMGIEEGTSSVRSATAPFRRAR